MYFFQFPPQLSIQVQLFAQQPTTLEGKSKISKGLVVKKKQCKQQCQILADRAMQTVIRCALSCPLQLGLQKNGSGYFQMHNSAHWHFL